MSSPFSLRRVNLSDSLHGLDVLVPAVSFIWLVLIYTAKKTAFRHPYPPGPRGLPIIGNVLDMPTSNEWLKAAEWKEKYGGFLLLFSLRLCSIVHFS